MRNPSRATLSGCKICTCNYLKNEYILDIVNLKRLFLYVLITSVALSALIGIGVLLFGNFGEFETRILMSTLIVTTVSVLGLACGACIEAGKGRAIPFAGIVFSIASGVLWMVMLWSPFEQRNDTFIHSLMTVTILALACAHVSLLSLATLERRFAWSIIAVHVFVWSLAGLTIFVIWAHIDPSQNMIARVMGVLSIVIAALTVVTPVFHKLSRSDDDTAKIDAEIEQLKEKIAELENRRASLSQSE